MDCKPCAPGSYNDGTQTTQPCTKCPEGYTSSETGATDASGCTGTCLNRWVHMNSSYLKCANDASGCPSGYIKKIHLSFIKIFTMCHFKSVNLFVSCV